MGDPDRFLEETVERSLLDYAEEGVREVNPVEVTREASARAGVEAPLDRGPWLRWGFLALVVLFAIVLLGVLIRLLPT